MCFKATILTLYPDIFPGCLKYSLSGRGLDLGLWQLDKINIRDYARDKHRTVDDTPYGGGAGMVMRADIVGRALEAAPQDFPCIYLTPRGKPYVQKDAQRFAAQGGVTILCGHFEGIDARVIESRAIEEISIGDYILSGGEVAAFPFLDAIIRLLPGIMGNCYSSMEESFENILLEHNQYTRPALFENMEVPEILRSGDHKRIAAYRQAEREKITKQRRPDLYALYEEKKAFEEQAKKIDKKL